MAEELEPPRFQRAALGDLAAAVRGPPVRVHDIPWPVLRAAGLGPPMMREVVDVRHQFDRAYVIDASATRATFGLAATHWAEVMAATAGAVPSTA